MLNHKILKETNESDEKQQVIWDGGGGGRDTEYGKKANVMVA